MYFLGVDRQMDRLIILYPYLFCPLLSLPQRLKKKKKIRRKWKGYGKAFNRFPAMKEKIGHFIHFSHLFPPTPHFYCL